MKKEEIITIANKICEDLSRIGVNANLEISHFYNRISIYVFDEGSNVLEKIDKPFTKNNTSLHKEITSKLRRFINNHQKQIA